MHANVLRRKHKAHAHACVLCWLTSCQRGRVFCAGLNGKKNSASWRHFFSPPLLVLEVAETGFLPTAPICRCRINSYAQHPSAVSPVFLSPLQFIPPPRQTALLHHPVCKPPWLRVLAAHACVYTHGRTPEHSDPPCFPSYVTVDKSGGRRR